MGGEAFAMKVLVTGGNGFLGRAIVRQLLDSGFHPISFARKPSAVLDSWRVEQVRGDIQDSVSTKVAVGKAEAIIHTAAKAGVWGAAREYENINIKGTQNLIRAARESGIQKFVYTSSPSVVFDGKDETNLSETQAPYPRSYLTDYSRTKAAAEKEVLAANGSAMATLALRPHLIWGPGDPHLLPRLWGRALNRRLKLVGNGRNRIDTTYIDNAASAHLCALEKLTPGASCGGQAYFISNGEPEAIADLFARFLGVIGLPPAIPAVSEWMAMGVGRLMELRARITGSVKEPLLTRFVVQQLAREHWFDLGKARRDLGYHPKVTISQGLERLKQSLSAVKMPDTPGTLSLGI